MDALNNTPKIPLNFTYFDIKITFIKEFIDYFHGKSKIDRIINFIPLKNTTCKQSQ